MKQLLQGIGASDGVAMGQIYLLTEPNFNIKDSKIVNHTKELDTYETALTKTISQLEEIKQIATTKLGSSKAEVFDAHIQIAQDPDIKTEIINLVKSTNVNIAYAVEQIYNKYQQVFKEMTDAYFKERSADIVDVKKRILSNILNVELPNILGINKEVIIVTYDLTPSQTALLDKKFVKGFATEIGGRTSHAAIMARTMEIPAVLGIKGITNIVKNGETLAINGITGECERNPNVSEWNTKLTHFLKEKEELKKYINIPTITKDKHKVHIESNVGKPNDATNALKNGAEGVGLYRSEFLYIDNDHWPTEDEQYEGYKSVLEQFGKDKLVVIRTLDIGGDKKLSYFEFPHEMNPFLGWRAIRVSLAKEDIFRTQIRALARASIHGKLGIMFPMIATIDEFKQAKAFTLKIISELKKEGKKISNNIQIGMMVEIPSSAALAKQFAKHADFFSIGTNDLIQYTFACDRMSQQVAYLYQPNNPALLTLIDNTIKSGHSKNRWVGMCGEMAGDILSIPLLLGLGLDAFSMSATSIPKARKIINNLKYKDCVTIAKKALFLETAVEVTTLVKKFLKAKKLL